MDVEEYKTIRDEMLQRFKWTVEISVFSVVSTGALLSWVFTKRSTETNPLLFICVGLGIVAYLFYAYLNILQGNYNRGSYLAVFHEVRERNFRWHNFNRFRNEMLREESDWGRDGKRGGYLLVILTFANISIPLLLLWNNLAIDWYLLFIIVFIVLYAWIWHTAFDLFKTRGFMIKNWKKWRKVKEELTKNPNLLEDTQKRVFGS